jgi:hypothetical protein
VFRGFGVDPTQYRSAAEALLRRLIKQGELPSIGTLVDLANLVSIRYALPVAVFDQGGITGGTVVRLPSWPGSMPKRRWHEFRSMVAALVRPRSSTTCDRCRPCGLTRGLLDGRRSCPRSSPDRRPWV